MKKTWIFRAAAFLSAFLLFQIQPMACKSLLPVFGGGYLVWGGCMVFFQAVLLAGYLYAHAAPRSLGFARHSRAHWVLLLAPALFFKPDALASADQPPDTWLGLSVTLSLASRVGFSAFALSTAGPLLQRWLSLSCLREREDPYFLYAASNLGSMLGLLTYPLVVEPTMSLETQWLSWRIGYVAAACATIVCMPLRSPAEERPTRFEKPVGRALAVWFALGAAGCAALQAVTNVITIDVASVPFLWALPLSAYLLSFVLAFKQKPWRPEWLKKTLPWLLMLGALLYLMGQLRLAAPALFAIAAHLSILFVACLECNSELRLSKPADPAHLTAFYLAIAAGGLAGSALVNWISPIVTSSPLEYPLSFALVVGAIAFAGRMRSSELSKEDPAPDRAGVAATICWIAATILALTAIPHLARACVKSGDAFALTTMLLVAPPVALAFVRMAGDPARFAAVLLAFSVGVAWTEDLAAGGASVKKLRNFYGIYKVFDAGNARFLQHGTTLHGAQRLAGPAAGTPLSYYHPTTPAAGLLAAPDMRLGRVGMVGLGAGALAAYAKPGQTYTMFELDPDNIPIAEGDFTFLDMARRAGATVDFRTGDGRLSLRRLKDAGLDLLIVDAFNSGSIPVHLMTVEAFGEYFRVLGADGLLLMHVSNRTLDLTPVVYSNARALGVAVCEKNNSGNAHPDANVTFWVALSKNTALINKLVAEMGWWQRAQDAKNLPSPWTDQYSNLLGAMIRK